MTCPWPSEDIPNEDTLFMRVHRNQVVDGMPIAGVFKNRPDPERPERPPAMSTDWNRYSTAEDTRNRARAPVDNGVIALNVGEVKAIPEQRVEHTPCCKEPEDPADPNNRAHTDVAGPKSHTEAEDPDQRIRVVEVRFRFTLIADWVIPPPE